MMEHTHILPVGTLITTLENGFALISKAEKMHIPDPANPFSKLKAVVLKVWCQPWLVVSASSGNVLGV